MTKQQMLDELSLLIRKNIPRLMELREGCVIEYFRGSRAYNCKVVETFPSYFNAYFDGEIESIDFELSENTFQIIGHDIMLNDVLEWLDDNKKDYGFNGEGYFYKEKRNEGLAGKELYNFVQWDLSKPYLKDQSEELIKFLYNIIKE